MSDCDPEKFINRGEEIDRVLKRVSDLAAGKPFGPKERVFHFVGPSGIGKSCLLKKIRYELISNQPKCVPLLIPLDTLKDGKRGFIVELLTLVHDEFCKCKETAPKKDQHFARHIQGKIGAKGQTVVILLDEINSPTQLDMHEMEEYLLVRLLHDNERAVLIMAGRSKPPMFNDFALRPTSFNTFPLSVFDEENTGKQLDVLKPGARNLAKRVVMLGSGVPGNTVKLVEHIVGKPLDIPNEAQAVRSLVAGIKNEIEGRFYPMLEAICILQGFYPDDVVPLFQCHPQLGAGWNESRVKEVFLELNRIQIGPGGLVDWEREKKHWAMDESARDLFEQDLRLREPDLWRELQCTAYEMYKTWGVDLKSKLYTDKSIYHQKCLHDKGMDCAGRGKEA